MRSPIRKFQGRIESLEDRRLLASDLLVELAGTSEWIPPITKFATDETLYVTGVDALHGRELWMIDASREARLVADLVPGSIGSNPRRFFQLADTVYFFADLPIVADSGDDIEGLYRTDGTADGTHLIAEVPSLDLEEVYRRPIEFANKTYFRTNDGLWVTDGTTDGTKLFDGRARRDGDVLVHNRRLYYVANDDWADDASTQFEDAIISSDGVSSEFVVSQPSGSINELAIHQGDLYYRAIETSYQSELWRFDQDTGSSVMLEVLSYSYLKSLFSVGESLFVLDGVTLWKSSASSGDPRALLDNIDRPPRWSPNSAWAVHNGVSSTLLRRMFRR